MAYASLRYEVAATGVATITLDVPQTRNALSDAVLDDLLAAFAAARDDDAVRCVVLTSAHETVFSSGGDLTGFADERSRARARASARPSSTSASSPSWLPRCSTATSGARRRASCSCSASRCRPRR